MRALSKSCHKQTGFVSFFYLRSIYDRCPADEVMQGPLVFSEQAGKKTDYGYKRDKVADIAYAQLKI